MRLRRWIFAAAGTVLACPLPAVAAQPAPQQPAAAEVEAPDDEATDAAEPVARASESLLVEESLPYVPTSNTIATKLPVDLAWTPAHVGVVTAAMMAEQGAIVLTDALENVSGLNTQSGFGVFDFFVVRGFDSLTSGLVLTDGAPEPEATYYQLYNAERVEVLKGPSGFLYGPNPLAAAVNIVRKQPVPGSRWTTFGASLGSFDTFGATVDANASSSSGDLAFRFNGLRRDSDGYRDDRQSATTAANPAFTWRPDDSTSVNVNLEYVAADFDPDAGLPIVDGKPAPVPRRRSFASPFDRSEQDIYRLQVDFERQLSGRLTLRNKTYYRQLDWLSDGTLLGFVLPTIEGSLEVTRSLLLLDDDQRFLGNQFEAVWTAQTGKVGHRLVTGLELGRLDDDYTLDVALLPSIDLFHPVETAAQPFFMLPDQSAAGDSRSRVIAPYLIDQMEVSPRLRFLLGARFDSIDFEDDVSGTSRSDSELSPMAGVVFAPVESLSLYANVSGSFAPPSPRVTGERRPEESREVEVGARKSLFGGRLRGSLSLFRLQRENIAIPDDNGFTQQAGDQTAKGAELEASADLPGGLRAFLAYAYTDSKLTRFAELVPVGFPPHFVSLDRSGNRSAFSPEHLANFWLSKRVGQRWTLSGGLRYVSEQFIAEDNVTRLGDYLLLQAGASYTTGNWRWSLNVENLTNEEYESRGFGAASVIPAAPASATLGVAYRL